MSGFARPMLNLRAIALVIALGIAAPAACNRNQPAPIAPPPPAAPAPASPPPAVPSPTLPPVVPVASLPVAPEPEPPPPGALRVALVYTTNVRGQYERWGRPAHKLGGLARHAALITALRKSGAPLLQVDAGDLVLPPRGQVAFLDGDPPEQERRAEFMLRTYARIGVAAVVPGEIDLSLGVGKLVELARKAKLSFLCSNLLGVDAKPVFESTKLVSVGSGASKTRIGVFGLLDPPAEDTARLQAAGFTFTSLGAAARAAVTVLRGQGAQVVVGLFHLAGGAAQAVAVTTLAPGVDVVVLGHEGLVTDQPLFSREVRLVEAGLDGKVVGQLDLHVTADARHFGGNHIHALDRTLVDDAAVTALVQNHGRDTSKRAETGRLLAVDIRLANADAPVGKAGGKPPPRLVENWTFGSTGACVLCHKEESVQWKTTSHAYALESLKTKGRDQDPECLQCHTTAFLRPGGTRSLPTARQYLPDVGCESCHGASVEHVRAQNKKTGTIRKANEITCRECHPGNRKGELFDVAAELKGELGPGHGQ